MYMDTEELGIIVHMSESDWYEFVFPILEEENELDEGDELLEAKLDSLSVENNSFIFHIACRVKSGDNFIYSANFQQILDADII